VVIKSYRGATRIKEQRTPIKDIVDFKQMGGNEILLNLDNSENLMTSEIVNGLIELQKRDKKNQFDFTKNPFAMKAVQLLQQRVGLLSSKHVL
jgi:hypothetical protein